MNLEELKELSNKEYTQAAKQTGNLAVSISERASAIREAAEALAGRSSEVTVRIKEIFRIIFPNETTSRAVVNLGPLRTNHGVGYFSAEVERRLRQTKAGSVTFFEREQSEMTSKRIQRGQPESFREEDADSVIHGGIKLTVAGGSASWSTNTADEAILFPLKESLINIYDEQLSHTEDTFELLHKKATDPTLNRDHAARAVALLQAQRG